LTGSSPARHTTAGAKTFPESSAGERTAQRAKQWAANPAANPNSRERIEPRIEDYGMPSDAYERLHGIGRDFGEYHPPQRGGVARLSRLTLMAGVFILGAGVGLAAAWWLYRDPPFAAIPASQMRSIPSPPAADAQRPAAARGISPGELPYDGAPPPTAAEPAIDDRPEIAVEGKEAAPSADASGDSAADADEVRTAERDADRTAERDGGTEPPKAAAATTRNPVVKSADKGDEPKAAKPATQGGTGVASAVPKRKSVPRSDREIERIRQQAEDELKKKTEHGRGPGESRPGAKQGARDDDRAGNRVSARTPISRVAATRTMLARCERSGNFIRREICRWQVCNGSWGKNGCPSYQQQTSTY